MTPSPRAALVTVLVAAIATAHVACGSSGPPSGAEPTADAGTDASPGTCTPPSFRGGADLACVTGPYATCAEGMQPRASGWGCEAVVAPEACKGATRDAFGTTECVPVGDCDAPFPPPGATHFVAAGGRSDATHFTTVAAAVAAAPAGSVIAVAEGSYSGQVLVDRPLTVLGRCPAKVTLLGGEQTLRIASVGVTVRGVTVRAGVVGVSLANAAELTLEDAVVDGNTIMGISQSDGGSRLTASRIVVRGTKTSGGVRGTGLNLQAGAVATIADASFAGNASQNVRVSSTSEIVARRTIFRDGVPAPGNDFGRGLEMSAGAKGRIEASAFMDNADIAVVVGDGVVLELANVTIARTRLAKSGSFGRAVNAFGGAVVRAEGLHVHDNHDASIMVAEAGTSLRLRRSSVTDTAFDREGYVGRGIVVQEGAAVDVEDCAIAGSKEVAFAAFGEGTRATVRRSVITGTGPNAGDYFGHGVMATLGALVVLEDGEIAANAGVGIAVGNGAARIARMRVRKNQVGLYVQEGTALREVAAAEDPSAGEVTVSTDTVFEENASKLSAGVLPLPEPSRIAP